jgi:hypothetical protein
VSTASARRVSRDSERRRRALGKAETPEHQRARYAADPEPQRAACRDYYAGNREQVKASVSAYYQANREQILARRRKAYAARKQAGAAAVPPLPGRACGPVTLRGQLVFPVGWPVESDAAVRICTTWCPVYARCAQWAITQPDQPGILGGLNAEQRRRGGDVGVILPP